MLARTRSKTNIGIGGGFGLCILGAVLAQSGPALFFLCALLGVAGFVYGCFSYAKGKGYPAALGLLGLLGFVGLIVLAVLPDKFKCCETNGESCTHGAATPRAMPGARPMSRAA